MNIFKGLGERMRGGKKNSSNSFVRANKFMSCTLGLRLYDSQLLFDKLLDSEVNEKILPIAQVWRI